MGEVFAGRYELLEPIGSGGMGTVWLVHDRRDDAVRAAKLVRQVDAALLLRFVRELSTRVEHPHTVRPLGWAGEDDTVLFTMDVVRGGSVHDLLEDFGALPVSWAACLLDQLLDALGAVHDAGVLHRDVKPANLLLEPTGRSRPYLRLSDFGVAAPLYEPRMTGPAMVLGTRGYRAPESLVGADLHPTQDLYGVGVVLAEMLSGERPQEGAPLAPTPPARVDHRLWRLALGLTDPDPRRRPQSATDARAYLRSTGLVPPDGSAPADEGADIEVFAHVTVPGEEPVEPERSPVERTLPPVQPVAAPAPPRQRTRLATGGFAAIGLGVALLVVMAVLLLG
ncbi:serine/threonine-protein kinase [Mumia sp. Pv 4-285]|uniref:serine/threonine-protein kinase n=1 Tax=Mumia qirimensis TaxID=3234852 RepID=UPI00351CDF1B